MRLTASARLPLSWVDNAEWIRFCDEFLPAAKSPSWKTLTCRLLPAIVGKFHVVAQAAVQGHEATVQADGWMGQNKHHLIAIMIIVDRKSRRQQIIFNLVVGDYFKSNADVLEHTDAATQLITWLCSKTFVLALLCDAQIEASGEAKAVIHAVLTRWMAHYMPYRQLLELQPILTSQVYLDDTWPDSSKQLITGDRDVVKKAQEMVVIIKNPLFWHGIARMKCHLEPLAYAANITQVAICHIDEVLMTFGWLVMHYKQMITDPDDAVGCQAIINSIEQWWAKADQDIFIAAVILNPFYASWFSQ
ncbi:hypothetical protein BJV74DRAFT_796328 [Russula compacta]|nr:hypothetical protein BJV74DRAFT_796328 [Russula compacta]